MNPLHSDARLARRVAAGDERAFAAIYRRYHQDLYRFCLAIVGRPEDAQDALQNTIVKALRKLPGEERTIQLKPWLYRVAHNESVDLLRRRREGPPLESVAPALTPTLTETVARREHLARLLSDLETLPERQRAALVMRELAGLEYGQIAGAIDSSEPVARQTVYEARLNLRELEAGREMDCELVTRQISDADGRVTRRRDIQAHLRSCADCRAFRDAIPTRRDDLAAVAPLPAVAAGSILQSLLGGGHGAGLGGAGAGVGTGVGKVVTTSALVKSAATVAAVAAIGVTAADRSGLIHTGLPGGRAESSAVPGGVERDRAAGDGGGGSSSAATPGGSEKETAGRGHSDAKSTGARNTKSGSGPDHHATAGKETAAAAPAGDAARGHLPSASSHGQETAASHGGGRAAAEAKSQAGQAHGGQATPPQASGGGESSGAGNKRPENPAEPANPPDTTPSQPLQPPKAKPEPGPPDGQGGH